MDTQVLLREILHKLARYKILILITGVVIAGLFYLKAKKTAVEYTSKATIFPLNNPSDNALSSSTLSSILGISEAPKSFSSEASISILELASSRNVREAVAAVRLPQFQNKTIAELLIEERNKHLFFWNTKTEMPKDSVSIIVTGGKLLTPAISSKINKNGVLELYYTGTREDYIEPISRAIIEKISQFYIDLRIEKAKVDYDFTLKKIDSLQPVLDRLDSRTIYMQHTTMFTPGDKLDYAIPKENLIDERTRVAHERDVSINNREEALWRLQKETPVVETLDQPTGPFEVKQASGILYSIIGFVLGALIVSLCLITPLLLRYVKHEIATGLLGNPAAANNTSEKL